MFQLTLPKRCLPPDQINSRPYCTNPSVSIILKVKWLYPICACNPRIYWHPAPNNGLHQICNDSRVIPLATITKINSTILPNKTLHSICHWRFKLVPEVMSNQTVLTKFLYLFKAVTISGQTIFNYQTIKCCYPTIVIAWYWDLTTYYTPMFEYMTPDTNIHSIDETVSIWPVCDSIPKYTLMQLHLGTQHTLMIQAKCE